MRCGRGHYLATGRTGRGGLATGAVALLGGGSRGLFSCGFPAGCATSVTVADAPVPAAPIHACISFSLTRLTDAEVIRSTCGSGRGGPDAGVLAPPIRLDAFRACRPILCEVGSLTDVAVRSAARGLVYAKTGTLVGDDLLTDRVACAGQGTRRILHSGRRRLANIRCRCQQHRRRARRATGPRRQRGCGPRLRRYCGKTHTTPDPT
jgi:hypothetical protein